MKGLSLRNLSYTSLLASLLVLSAVSSVITYTNASAASEYDEYVSTVKTSVLEVATDNYYGATNCPATDVSLSWSGTEFANNSLFSRSNHADVYANFNAAVTGNGAWGVKQIIDRTGSGGAFTHFQIFWVQDKTKWHVELSNADGGRINFVRNTGETAETAGYMSYATIGSKTGWLGSGGSCDVGYMQGDLNSYSSQGFLVSNADNERLFLSTFDQFYPEGYEGEFIPGGVEVDTKIKPKVSYIMDTMNLTALYLRNLDLESHNIKWVLYDHDSTDILKEQTRDRMDTFQYQFTELGTYDLNVSFESKGIPYPGLPDGYEYITLVLPIKVNGDSYSSDDKQQDCDEDGACGVASDYEDCSTFGTDIVGGFGCHIGNFATRLRIMLTSLFVPDASDMADKAQGFLDFIQKKLGFVYQSVAIITDLFTSTISGLATPNCVLSYGNLSGENVSLSLCDVRDMIGAAPFDIALNIFRGVTALAFMFSCARYLNQFFSNRSQAAL